MTALELPLYSIIPHEILVAKDIQPAAKIFYGVLSGLCRKEGYCWASDEQLAEMMETKERTLKSWLLALGKGGFIHRKTENKSYRDDEGKLLWKKTRKIYLSVAYSNKKSERAENDPINEGAENCPIDERAENCPYKEGISDKGISKEESEPPPPPSEPCNSYGSDDLVKLTPSNHDKLKAEFGEVRLAELIEDLNDYIGASGKEYKSHYHTLKSWYRKDRKAPMSKGNRYEKTRANPKLEADKANAYDRLF